jgi:hypothetical protein
VTAITSAVRPISITGPIHTARAVREIDGPPPDLTSPATMMVASDPVRIPVAP